VIVSINRINRMKILFFFDVDKLPSIQGGVEKTIPMGIS